MSMYYLQKWAADIFLAASEMHFNEMAFFKDVPYTIESACQFCYE